MLIQDLDIADVSSERRNPILANVMAQLDYMEKRGGAITRICNETQASAVMESATTSISEKVGTIPQRGILVMSIYKHERSSLRPSCWQIPQYRQFCSGTIKSTEF